MRFGEHDPGPCPLFGKRPHRQSLNFDDTCHYQRKLVDESCTGCRLRFAAPISQNLSNLINELG